MGCRGRRMEAPWSPQWSLNGRYWSAKGGTMVVKESRSVAKIDTQYSQYGETNGRPLCIHTAPTAMSVPSSCLLCSTCDRPTSSATFVRCFHKIFSVTNLLIYDLLYHKLFMVIWARVVNKWHTQSKPCMNLPLCYYWTTTTKLNIPIILLIGGLAILTHSFTPEIRICQWQSLSGSDWLGVVMLANRIQTWEYSLPNSHFDSKVCIAQLRL